MQTYEPGPSQSRTEKGEVKTRQKNTDAETGHRKSEDRKEGSPAVENMSSAPKRKQIKEQGAISLYVSLIWIAKGREGKSKLIDDNLRCHI